MGIIAANMFLTLDGVYQAPGGREEDSENSFEYGGWQAPFMDDESNTSIDGEIDRIDALLMGRKTYDIFASFWPGRDDPVGRKFDSVPKFVVSRTLTDPSWEGTTVLADAAAAGRLREDFEQVQTFGSGDLLQSMFTEDVVDRLNLWLYPVTFGTGKRLFAGGTIPAAFRLVSSQTFPKGSVSLVYERAGEVVLQDMPAD